MIPATTPIQDKKQSFEFPLGVPAAPPASRVALARLYHQAADTWRPVERVKPSEWAARHRWLKGGKHILGGHDVRWRNDVFPGLVPIMDGVQEAMDTGKTGVCVMKSGQCGVSEAIINSLGWLLTEYPGPALYLISTDKLAINFATHRIGHMQKTAPPLKRKALTSRGSGQSTASLEFTDCSINLFGGQSVTKIESLPYRFVLADELDSIPPEYFEKGDFMELAENRTDAFESQTLIIAWSHPTTPDYGSGKLYYDLTDQRRAHIACPHCSEWFWLRLANEGTYGTPDKKALGTPNLIRYDPTRATIPNVTQAEAEFRPECWVMLCPHCELEVTDPQRYEAFMKVEQRSVLPPAEAAAKSWIGMHMSQLQQRKPLRELARRWIGSDQDPSKRRALTNRMTGDVFLQTVKETTSDDWSRCIIVPRETHDPDAYRAGWVPRGVQFLTAGFDARETELHWMVSGWGSVRNAKGYPVFRGWIIDYGLHKREKSPDLEAAELHVFDQLVYLRPFPRTIPGQPSMLVKLGAHDSGWQPVAVYEYCRWQSAAMPCKGGASDSSKTIAPPWRKSGEISPYVLSNGETIFKTGIKILLLNTHDLKNDLTGWIKHIIEIAIDDKDEEQLADHRRLRRLTLPTDAGDDLIAQLSSERRTSQKGKEVWVARGPNHWFDCFLYTYAVALSLRPTQAQLPFDEAAAAERKRREVPYKKRRQDRRRGRR